jgi:hypothetical protein
MVERKLLFYLHQEEGTKWCDVRGTRQPSVRVAPVNPFSWSLVLTTMSTLFTSMINTLRRISGNCHCSIAPENDNFKRFFKELSLQFRKLIRYNLSDAIIFQVRECSSTLRYCILFLSYRTTTLKAFTENITEDPGLRDGALCRQVNSHRRFESP